MRDDMAALLTALLERSRTGGGIDIDELGDAITPLGLGPFEIESLMDAFERAGGIVHAPTGGGNAERLKTVLASARALTSVLGRRPTVVEIAEHAKMEVVLVRHALAVGRVLGR